jgi:outer membrane protein assembly factor BamB
VLLVAGPGPGAVCLRVPRSGKPTRVWHDRRRLDSQFNTLVHHAGHVYGFTSSRQGGAVLRCLEVATGRQCWEYPSDLYRGQALAADGCLILLGERGHLASVELDPARLIVRSELSEPLLAALCYAAPALHRGRLYVRNDRALLCLNLQGYERVLKS